MDILGDFKELGMMAIITAVLGGIIAYLLGLLMGPIVGMDALFGPLIGGIIAAVLLLYVFAKTDLDVKSFGYIVLLLLLVSIVGTFIVGLLPAAAPYILTLSGTLTWGGVAWSLVYVGLAMAIYDMIA